MRPQRSTHALSQGTKSLMQDVQAVSGSSGCIPSGGPRPAPGLPPGQSPSPHGTGSQRKTPTPGSSIQCPVTFSGWPMARGRAVTDGRLHGNGSGGQKCRGRSQGTAHLGPDWTRPQCPSFLRTQIGLHQAAPPKASPPSGPRSSANSLSRLVPFSRESNAGGLGCTSKPPTLSGEGKGRGLPARPSPCSSQERGHAGHTFSSPGTL